VSPKKGAGRSSRDQIMYGARFIKRYLFLKDLDIVVETSNACNARCVWCWMYNCGRKTTGLMRLEQFKRFVDLNLELLKRNRIVPFHRGEALIHPDILPMLEYATEKGAPLGLLNTNLSCKIDMKRLVSLPIPLFIVNLGGTTKQVHEKVMRNTDWELVTDNLQALFELAKDHGRRVQVKMNVTRHNVRQVDELAGLVEQLGGRAEDAVIGTTGFALPSLATSEEKALFIEEVASDEARPYLRFTYDESCEDFNIRAKDRRKLCRFLMPTVKFDGTVTVCCHDQLDQLDLGNAFDVPLERIIRGSRYTLAMIRGLFKAHPICRDCN